MMYDFLVVGSGLFGSVFANRAKGHGYSCLVLEKRSHVGGNVYTENMDGIDVHRYGAHIFHTNDSSVWSFLNSFTSFNHFINCPIANYHGEIYNLPFNMNTFNRLWGVTTPTEAMKKIKSQQNKSELVIPRNLKEQAISLVGSEIYQKLICGYTEKQWGRPCTDLPTSIIKRLPVRFTYDNRYFDDIYQGVPEEGYTCLIQKMLEGIEVVLESDYLHKRDYWDSKAACVIYTGPIDAFFDYRFGALQYRSLEYKIERMECSNYQGNAVVNYTDRETEYIRVIEHKHFVYGNQPHTIISKEYSIALTRGKEPFYPINDEHNNALYHKYKWYAEEQSHVLFCGRLGEYQYFDMDEVVKKSMELSTLDNLKKFLNIEKKTEGKRSFYEKEAINFERLVQ